MSQMRAAPNRFRVARINFAGVPGPYIFPLGLATISVPCCPSRRGRRGAREGAIRDTSVDTSPWASLRSEPDRGSRQVPMQTCSDAIPTGAGKGQLCVRACLLAVTHRSQTRPASFSIPEDASHARDMALFFGSGFPRPGAPISRSSTHCRPIEPLSGRRGRGCPTPWHRGGLGPSGMGGVVEHIHDGE